MESLAVIYKLHTPEQLQFYSNLVHWIVGGLFLIVAGVALVQTLGYLRSQKALYIWPMIILVAAFFLPIFAFSHHLNQLTLAWKATIYDPQQLQHMIMAVLIAVAGGAEAVYLMKRERWQVLQLVLPLVLTIIGLMFLTHPQHGTSEAVLKAATIHKYLGSVLIFAGLFKAAEVFGRNRIKWIAFPWIIFLTIAALLLISYREPQGAYKIDVNQNVPQMEHIDHMQ